MTTKKVSRLVIWKWVSSLVALQSPVTLEMPKGAKVVFAKDTNRGFKIWALVNPDAKVLKRTFVLAKTGTDIPKGAAYLGSYNGSPTWHIFELKTKTVRSARTTKRLKAKAERSFGRSDD
jgi:hypothetical protein